MARRGMRYARREERKGEEGDEALVGDKGKGRRRGGRGRERVARKGGKIKTDAEDERVTGEGGKKRMEGCRGDEEEGRKGGKCACV